MTDKRTQTKRAYCPNCKFFMLDCSVDPEDYDLPCDAFEDTDHSDDDWEKEVI